MIRAAAAALAAATLLGACAGGGQQRARRAAHDDLTLVTAVPAPVRNGASGAPVDGLQVSGTITNTGDAPLHCHPTAFLLVDQNGDAISPAHQWCDVPAIGPGNSAGFTATFATTQRAHLELRFLHPDGSYEAHPLTVPPA